MKFIAIACAVLTLAGCETMRAVAPQTVAGFEANGVLGALDGATGAVLARCRTLDGEEIRVAIDGLAGLTGLGLDYAREQRRKACAVVGAVAILGDGLAAPAAGVTIHRAGEDHQPND
jgi:hypothetical protein